MKKFLVQRQQPLKEFLANQLKISKNSAKTLIDNRIVFVNNKRVWIASYLLNKGDIVEVADFNESIQLNPIKIYEDDYIIAVNKPPFIVSDNSKDSLEENLRQIFKNPDIKAIHRLDKETSGIIIFAKNFSIYEAFKSIWEEKAVKKIYLAISHNEANFTAKTVISDIDGKEAISKIRLLKKAKGFSYFEIEIFTGRKHQIRKHLSHIRHPVVGDKIYGPKRLETGFLKSIKRHMLHAFKLEFVHPFTSKKISLKAQPPADFMNVLHYMK